MTRDEAEKAIAADFSLVGPKLIRAFESLGMLKLDESKPVNAWTVMHDIIGPKATNEVWYALSKAGLQIVKRS
ncbi:hypothetical protein [Bradyrhizobium sp.]|uniref:hypothetical protein n=1 Tax=Bradyrhizobium sp. TaxID=376 RepID=UPI0025C65009|nr:hypothetical protein [Bradyrhizobium sp.]